jgi:pimeloyl-ACP methyl ester carboxylesterase
MFVRAVAAALLAVVCFPAAAEIVTLKTRGEVTQSFALVAPEKPVAAAILFPGGGGVTPLDKLVPGQFINRGNFLVRVRYDLARAGLAVAIVDAPSDRQGERGMKGGFRGSAEHAEDIAAVVEHLRARFRLPVWLVGTSAGTESAAFLATRLGERVAGVVLTSSISQRYKMGFSVLELPLATVRVPALIVAHKDDGCWATPAHQAEAIARAFGASSRKEVLIVEGGDPPRSEPCEALSQHGFLGIEKRVVDAIAAFIKGG